MVSVDTTASLESFRRFLIYSTCGSFIPEGYLRDSEVFPEKEEGGSIYLEAADKVTLKKIRDISFVNAREVLGVIYVSKSGNSRLRWRQIRGRIGRVTGEASPNSLVNLILARVITREYAELLLKGPLPVKPGAVPAAVAEDSASSNAGSQGEAAPPDTTPFA